MSKPPRSAGEPVEELPVRQLGHPGEQRFERGFRGLQQRARGGQQTAEPGGQRGPRAGVGGPVDPGGHAVTEDARVLLPQQHAHGPGGTAHQRRAVGGQPGQGVGEPDTARQVRPVG
ncbi:hypothetical protein GCM10020295_76900 [Streptomyces cinereospinus]